MKKQQQKNQKKIEIIYYFNTFHTQQQKQNQLYTQTSNTNQVKRLLGLISMVKLRNSFFLVYEIATHMMFNGHARHIKISNQHNTIPKE